MKQYQRKSRKSINETVSKKPINQSINQEDFFNQNHSEFKSMASKRASKASNARNV